MSRNPEGLPKNLLRLFNQGVSNPILHVGRSNEQSGATANADQRDLADALRIAGWDVHPASSELIRGSKCLRLEPKVMDVLVLLARHPGQVLTRTEI